jgi:hypothetical protein
MKIKIVLTSGIVTLALQLMSQSPFLPTAHADIPYTDYVISDIMCQSKAPYNATCETMFAPFYDAITETLNQNVEDLNVTINTNVTYITGHRNLRTSVASEGQKQQQNQRALQSCGGGLTYAQCQDRCGDPANRPQWCKSFCKCIGLRRRMLKSHTKGEKQEKDNVCKELTHDTEEQLQQFANQLNDTNCASILKKARCNCTYED